MRKILIYALAIFFGVSCAEDKGNYSYSAINEITQEGFVKDYSVERLSKLTIPCPKLNFALGEIKDLSYEWRIDYKVVSTEKDLDVVINTELGRKAGSLTVIDNATKLKYYFDFGLLVSTRFKNGIHFLVEKEGGESSLTFMRRDTKDAQFLADIYRQENPEMGELGRKPVQLIVSENMATGTRNPVTSIYVLNSEGTNKITVLNKETIKLSRIMNESTITASLAPVTQFNPSFMTNLPASVIIADKKAYLHGAAGTTVLYRSANLPCEFAPYTYTDSRNSASYWYAFDELTSKLGMLNAKPMGSGDVFALDVWTPFGGVSTPNQTLKSSGIADVSGTYSETTIYQLAMYNKTTKKLAFYNHRNEFKAYGWGVDYSTPPTNTLTLVNELSDIADDNSIYYFAPATRMWYIATGTKLYKKYWETETPTLIWESKTGNIVALDTNTADEKGKELQLYVATYDATSSNAKKSSLYVIDTEKSAEIEKYAYVLDRCVSMVYVTVR